MNTARRGSPDLRGEIQADLRYGDRRFVAWISPPALDSSSSGMGLLLELLFHHRYSSIETIVTLIPLERTAGWHAVHPTGQDTVLLDCGRHCRPCVGIASLKSRIH